MLIHTFLGEAAFAKVRGTYSSVEPFKYKHDLSGMNGMLLVLALVQLEAETQGS